MITLAKAIAALRTSEQKAEELGIKVSTAVVDDHGLVIAFSRMDGAILTSPAFAQQKAFTSATLGMPSEGPAAYAGEGKPYYGMASTLGGQYMLIAGGIPVMHDNKIIGAVGVGGSMDVSQDAECAKAAAAAL